MATNYMTIFPKPVYAFLFSPQKNIRIKYCCWLSIISATPAHYSKTSSTISCTTYFDVVGVVAAQFFFYLIHFPKLFTRPLLLRRFKYFNCNKNLVLIKKISRIFDLAFQFHAERQRKRLTHTHSTNLPLNICIFFAMFWIYFYSILISQPNSCSTLFFF